MIKVCYRKKEEIWKHSDRFRESPPLIGYNTPPIDSVVIAEIVLKLDLVPFPYLFSKYKMDAALMMDLTGIYVDEQAYLEFEEQDYWIEKRLRFSLAHEIGHYVLHAKEIKANRFTSLIQYIQWMGDRQNPDSPEYQADEFAGRFLIPREILLERYDYFYEKAGKHNPDWLPTPEARRAFAKKLAPLFGVNPQVIETRFEREYIWPAE